VANGTIAAGRGGLIRVERELRMFAQAAARYEASDDGRAKPPSAQRQFLTAPVLACARPGKVWKNYRDEPVFGGHDRKVRVWPVWTRLAMQAIAVPSCTLEPDNLDFVA